MFVQQANSLGEYENADTLWGKPVTFSPELQNSLRDRTSRVPIEYAAGLCLEQVLSRHLLAVESTANTALLTSILLLDPDGRRLRHAAAPSLPDSYCDAINGAEIGPSAGSCGTAAFEGRAIYVTDIATDPLWSNYRHLALAHGLRACWSTPIFADDGVLVGTFAVYHLTPRGPTRDEVDAIEMIAGHVAQAIQKSGNGDPIAGTGASKLFASADQYLASDLLEDSYSPAGRDSRTILRSIESDFNAISQIIERAIDVFPDADLEALGRAMQAAEHGAALARKSIKPD